jgi:hypothetical protein
MAAALWALIELAGYAHHPRDTYHLDRQITIDGEIVRATYGEPHSFLHVREVRAGNGGSVWIVEFPGAGSLRARGLTPQSLQPGERVTLTGHPGRIAADPRLLLRTLVRARDRWTWSAS